MLKSFALGAVALGLVLGAASAEQMRKPTTDRSRIDMDRTGTTTTATTTTEFLTTLPANAMLVSNVYNQNVYDPQEDKIGEIKDIVVDRDGAMAAAIVSVGGFLGMGEKDVAVPFNAIMMTQRNNKNWLTMNTTKDALKGASGFRFDRSRGLWTLASDR